jgi:hypothetical protein
MTFHGVPHGQRTQVSRRVLLVTVSLHLKKEVIIVQKSEALAISDMSVVRPDPTLLIGQSFVSNPRAAHARSRRFPWLSPDYPTPHTCTTDRNQWEATTRLHGYKHCCNFVGTWCNFEY